MAAGRAPTPSCGTNAAALIQDMVVHPPNPAILVKLLTSLAPEIYGEKSTIEHHHTGAVWIEGGASQQAALPPPRPTTSIKTSA